jgi:alkylation response protein AidB-like acyl-CoA dehydrogenase
MLLDLNADQVLFRDTTARLLEELAPVSELRRLRDDADGFDPGYWRRGAELGWSSLLVSETHGGGSIGGQGLVDLALVAHEFGRHAAPGPLAVTNIVAATLSEAADEGFAPAIKELLSGEAIATWCLSEPPPNHQLDSLSFDIRREGDQLVLTGVKRPVESAARARYLLVTGRTGSGLTQVLVPRATAGVSVKPLRSLDTTRRFDVVIFEGVRIPLLGSLVGEVGSAADQVQRQVGRAVALANAEAVGAMQAAFDMTVDWAFARYSFGRPLASYQELKHRFADMKTWLEASHAVSDAAIDAAASSASDAGELLSAAKSFIGDFGGELMQDCVQMHGGIGVTFEHDLHLYLRRHSVNRALYGTPSEHRQRLAALAERQVGAL